MTNYDKVIFLFESASRHSTVSWVRETQHKPQGAESQMLIPTAGGVRGEHWGVLADWTLMNSSVSVSTADFKQYKDSVRSLTIRKLRPHCSLAELHYWVYLCIYKMLQKDI